MKAEGKGIIAVIFDTQVLSEKFKKREFVIESSETGGNGQVFTQNVKFQLMQDKCSILDQYNVGDEVSVAFNVNGRKWEKEGKVSYFNSLDAWKITKLEGSAPAPATTTANDDLPF